MYAPIVLLDTTRISSVWSHKAYCGLYGLINLPHYQGSEVGNAGLVGSLSQLRPSLHHFLTIGFRIHREEVHTNAFITHC